MLAEFDRLVQAVLAIGINALQVLKNGDHVRLSVAPLARDGRDWGVIEVWNDGPPLPADLKDRLFDPFVTTRPEGTGLGLAAAWRIAQDHGGHVVAEDLDYGVAFRLVLPVRQ